MFFPGKIVTRVFQFTLRNNLGKSKIRRISSVVFSKSPYRVNSIEGVYRAFVAGKFHVNNTITQVRAMGALSPLDPSSYARPELAVIKHISLSLNVDFNEKVISAVATYSLDVLQNLTEVILDTSNLTIKSIETVDGQPLQFKFGEEIPNFGSKLTITLSQAAFAEEQALPEQPCKECVPIPAALDDITLNYNGFVYEPELVGVSDEERKNYIADHDTKPCSCFYVTDTKSRASRGNRVTLESSHASYPASSPKSAKHKCCDDGYITVIGTDGIPHRITTIDELTTYGGIPPKDVKGRKVVPPQKPGGAPSKPDGVPPWENENVSPSILDGVLPTWLQAIIKPSKKLTNVRLSDMGNSKKVKFVIKYSTAPTASGLQWLDPNQTSGKKHPYLFSQLQPIHARSILPCQDTPAVKFTYDAEVTAPAEFTVLMSALRGEVKGNKTSFNQPMPLPSYLVAIAVGVLQSKNLGPRSRVWAETEELDRSAWEFAETERYLKAAEKLCGPYEWTEYDLLVLPPSFPYGGMENPCLTFVTPTLLAGDRSQADVIVHEIMHSWTGNLVTNRNFEHFWLNEGFTVYLERKVGASLIEDPEEAKRSRDFHSILGLQELTETIQTLGPNSGLTQLVPDLKSVHPDDAFSRVPYEKGSLFLRYLEDLVGGPEVFDDFLRSYLRNYSKKSLDTNDFKKYLLTYFNATNKLDEVNWDAWLYTPGMPPVIPAYDTNMTRSVTNLVKSIVESDATFAWKDVKSFTPHQMIYLLQALLEKDPLPLPALHSLGKEYKVQDNKNTEIRYRWLRLCISSQDVTKLDEVFEFLNSQGRMKYVRPIYRDLYAWKQVRERTIVNFLSNEKYMMHVSAYTLRKDLHLND